MRTRSAGTMTTPVQGDDADLVRRLRAGDAAAGDQLVAKYCPALLGYLRRLVKNDHIAEELHQQTWAGVLEHLDRFDVASGAGGFKAWLFRIATNKANDHWRSQGRETAALDGLKLVSDELAPDASYGVENAEQMDKLTKAIGMLPELQRQILMLRYYSNLKFIEIAQILGCPLNTALGRMHKAMLRLKQVMS